MAKVILCVILLCYFVSCVVTCSTREDANHVLVKAPPGYVRGSVMKSRNGVEFFAFRGIRYAEAPVGVNRFMPQIPIKKWKGTYNATADGPVCPQLQLASGMEMSEDCLFVNVYTRSTTIRQPVLVFIHGGAFYLGAGRSDVVGPQYLMDKNVVLVTFNYRLGALGFLSTKSKDVPGNNGFKDQVTALRWIRDNIAAFGGDPRRVTIWGQSAGAMSVSLHLTSPMSKGLFHRAILSSGSATSHFVPNNNYLTRLLAAKTNCLDANTAKMVDCLRELPVEKIIGLENARSAVEQFQTLIWYYEIEEDFGQERFLTEHPSVSVSKGDFARVPIVTGIVQDEFAMLAQVLYNSSFALEIFNKQFELIAPLCFQYESGTDRSKEISRTLKEAYLNNQTLTADNLQGLEHLFTDALIFHGVHRLVALARKFTNVYYYFFTYMGRYSQSYDPNGQPHGVLHSDDLQYVFVLNEWAPVYTKDDPENKMVELMTSWYTHFAATGDLNDNANKWTSKHNWIPSNATYSVTFEIGSSPRLIGEPFTNRSRIFDSLFPVP